MKITLRDIFNILAGAETDHSLRPNETAEHHSWYLRGLCDFADKWAEAPTPWSTNTHTELPTVTIPELLHLPDDPDERRWIANALVTDKPDNFDMVIRGALAAMIVEHDPKCLEHRGRAGWEEVPPDEALNAALEAARLDEAAYLADDRLDDHHSGYLNVLPYDATSVKARDARPE